ncbi:hypothetical protein QEV59_00070 [Trueperella pyogenes]
MNLPAIGAGEGCGHCDVAVEGRERALTKVLRDGGACPPGKVGAKRIYHGAILTRVLAAWRIHPQGATSFLPHPPQWYIVYR